MDDDKKSEDEAAEPARDAAQEEDAKLREVSEEELKRILVAHETWLETGEEKGKQADLFRTNLQGANLFDANLRRADLWEADLSDANLQGAHLGSANLRGANLWGVNLQEANLVSANLQGADLDRADLQEANLSFANLQGTNLVSANLTNAEGITREQLDEACGDDKTRLPDDLADYQMKACPKPEQPPSN